MTMKFLIHPIINANQTPESQLFVIVMSTRQWNDSEPSDEEINQETLSTRKRSSRGTFSVHSLVRLVVDWNVSL